MASEYARYVVNERAKKVMEDLDQACRYASDVIKGRWCQAELTIMKDPDYAYHYTKDVIKGRWPDVEPYFMSLPWWAYYYARKIINEIGRAHV